MNYPDFFDKVPIIELQDKLSDFLGAFEDGKVEISYLDCVKLAGHSCPTVAGAYLIALYGLKELYGAELPQRGEVHVSMKNSETEGVTGVICNVISFITGASGAGGFKGLNGKMSRNNLISYDVPIGAEVKLTRTDTNQSVLLSYDASSIAGNPNMQPLMAKSIQGEATAQEKREFGRLWQARTEAILLSDNILNNIITIQKG